LVKHISDGRKPSELLDHAIRQIVSKALVSDEIVDIFAAAGLKKPDISILSDEFLAEIRGMPQRNLAVELLRKLLVGEIKTRSQRNVVQARSFTELLRRVDPQIPEPRDRDRASNRRIDCARQGHARRKRAWRGTWAS
jgi:type I restriction enzyme, R subunit